jgi:hypothetical protein
MAVVAMNATKRGLSKAGVHGLSGTMKALIATVEVGSADTNASAYTFFRIPTDARILGTSREWHDDLASTGSPTLDIGLFAVNGNVTSDDDALNDGLDAASAGTGVAVVKDIANYGKRAWEFVNGQTTDPGGFFDVKITLQDAAVNVGGTVTLELHYMQD